MTSRRWVCFQIGAREHYAIPRALHRRGLLKALVTDAWVRPGNPVGHLPGESFRKLGERFDAELADADVRHFTMDAMAKEATSKLRSGGASWQKIIDRNEWFQRRAAMELESICRTCERPPIVFAYSYAAREVLAVGRKFGCKTVLCGIDPGPEEEDIVACEQKAHPGMESGWERAPRAYWESWREECQLADMIMVNSPWSRTAFMTRGISGDKISVLPLIYERPPAAQRARRYPAQFTAERPMRVLFLGSLILRKGIARVFDAIRLLQDDRIEFNFVGHEVARPPDDILKDRRVRWIGAVRRSETTRHYRRADLFILPTLSDGFALTQLEAQAHSLPMIVSDRCGEVVLNGETGLILAEPAPPEIAEKLRWCLNNPAALAQMSIRVAQPDSRFTESHVIGGLLDAAHAIDRREPLATAAGAHELHANV